MTETLGCPHPCCNASRKASSPDAQYKSSRFHPRKKRKKKKKGKVQYSHTSSRQAKMGPSLDTRSAHQPVPVPLDRRALRLRDHVGMAMLGGLWGKTGGPLAHLSLKMKSTRIVHLWAPDEHCHKDSCRCPGLEGTRGSWALGEKGVMDRTVMMIQHSDQRSFSASQEHVVKTEFACLGGPRGCCCRPGELVAWEATSRRLLILSSA